MWVRNRNEIELYKCYINLVYQEKLVAFDKENKHTSYISGKKLLLKCYLHDMQ